MENQPNASIQLPIHSQSVFDTAWLQIEIKRHLHHNFGLLDLLAEVEVQLGLSSGFLTNDENIRQNIKLQESGKVEKADMLTMLVDILEGLKVVDSPQNTFNSNDTYLSYRDNDDFDFKQDYEDEFDDEASTLMECGSWTVMSPTLGIFDEQGEKFDLYNILEDLKVYHNAISLNFSQIDSKLVKLKTQNAQDLEFLDKLTASNDLIHDRMHDMRTELGELAALIEEFKGKQEQEKGDSEKSFEKKGFDCGKTGIEKKEIAFSHNLTPGLPEPCLGLPQLRSVPPYSAVFSDGRTSALPPDSTVPPFSAGIAILHDELTISSISEVPRHSPSIEEPKPEQKSELEPKHNEISESKEQKNDHFEPEPKHNKISESNEKNDHSEPDPAEQLQNLKPPKVAPNFQIALTLAFLILFISYYFHP